MAAPYPTLTKQWHNSVYPALQRSIPPSSLSGKSAIVTGAAGGIGQAISRALATASIGTLVLIGRTSSTLESSKSSLEKDFPNTRFISLIADTTKKESIDAAVTTARQQIGKPIDILLANAGYLEPLATIAEGDPLEWWRPFEVNVLGTYLTVKAFLPVADSNATIINLTSGASHCEPFGAPGSSGYASSKMAGNKFFEHLQFENKALRVFSVHPGLVESGMLEKFQRPPMDDADLSATFMVWLCMPDADFLKGKILWANWDVDELKVMKEKITSSSLLTANLLGWPFAESSSV